MTFQLHPRTVRAITLGCLVVLVAASIATFVRDAHGNSVPLSAADPAATVRQFLIDAVVDNDGVQACRFMTRAERARVAQRAGMPLNCATGASEAELRLGGTPVTTESQVLQGVATSTSVTPTGVLVTVSKGGASHTFVLEPATAADLNEFAAPPTPWRIAGGAAALVPRDTHSFGRTTS